MSNAFASSVGGNGVEPPVTASAIVAEAVGSHILRIDGYSRTKGLGNGQFIASERFVVGGHRWYLEYYPDSQSSKNSDWISLFLNLDTVSFDVVKAKFTISLLNQDGNPVALYSKISPLCAFSIVGKCRMGCDLIKRSDLEGSDYLKDNVFSVKCVVSVVPKKIFTKAIPVSEARRRV